MLVKSTAIELGVILTLILGCTCGAFIKRSVTVGQDLIPGLEEQQRRGGGAQLGAIERLLFFAAFWLDQHLITGGWLAFKVAGKWAAWQHIAKIPAGGNSENASALERRSRLSSYLLGRFLNGTLYNGLCAGVGMIFGKTMLSLLLPEGILCFVPLALAVIILRFIYVSLFFDLQHFWRDFRSLFFNFQDIRSLYRRWRNQRNAVSASS
jgi:hypothetical protein